MAIGLLFLLPPERQALAVRRMAAALRPGGRLLLSAPRQAGWWSDLQTGRRSVSLGAPAYRRIVADAALRLAWEETDAGGSHYYAARRP